VSCRLTDAGQDCHRRTFFRDRFLFSKQPVHMKIDAYP
jgi:hypothetical protein